MSVGGGPRAGRSPRVCPFSSVWVNPLRDYCKVMGNHSTQLDKGSDSTSANRLFRPQNPRVCFDGFRTLTKQVGEFRGREKAMGGGPIDCWVMPFFWVGCCKSPGVRWRQHVAIGVGENTRVAGFCEGGGRSFRIARPPGGRGDLKGCGLNLPSPLPPLFLHAKACHPPRMRDVEQF